jgi:integrase
MKAKANRAERLRKIHALTIHGATQGERHAAQAALERAAKSAVSEKKKKRLTADTCRSLTAPGIYWNDDVPGFALRIAKGGTRTFVLRYRGDDRVEHQINIGRLGADWTFGAARDHAKELRRELAKGRDLAGERQDRRDAPTIGKLIARYKAEHLPTLAASTHGDQKTMLKEIEKHLGKNIRVADVTTETVAAMHRTIGESIGRNRVPREARANRILSVCSAMFRIAMRQRAGEARPWRDPHIGNPAKGIKKFHEENRDRFFGPGELAAIRAALDRYPGVAADVVKLCLYSGCRPKEALHAKWTEFEQPGFWLKPASHTKQRRPHKIPLNAAALAVIQKRRKLRTKLDGGFVFPSADKTGKPLATLHHVWTHVRAKTGIGKARIYDLRHSFASLGAAAGMGLPTIGKMLGHSSARTTERYAHLADDVLREATELIGSAIEKSGGTEAQP